MKLKFPLTQFTLLNGVTSLFNPPAPREVVVLVNTDREAHQDRRHVRSYLLPENEQEKMEIKSNLRVINSFANIKRYLEENKRPLHDFMNGQRIHPATAKLDFFTGSTKLRNYNITFQQEGQCAGWIQQWMPNTIYDDPHNSIYNYEPHIFSMISLGFDEEKKNIVNLSPNMVDIRKLHKENRIADLGEDLPVVSGLFYAPAAYLCD
jgi:hypothetical protein